MPFTVVKFAEATKLSLISIDSHGDIEFVNPSACALFGYTKGEMIGKPITIIIPERMRGAHMASSYCPATACVFTTRSTEGEVVFVSGSIPIRS